MPDNPEMVRIAREQARIVRENASWFRVATVESEENKQDQPQEGKVMQPASVNPEKANRQETLHP